MLLNWKNVNSLFVTLVQRQNNDFRKLFRTESSFPKNQYCTATIYIKSTSLFIDYKTHLK